MAGKTTLATLVLAVVAAAALMEGAAATVYFVGDTTAWTIPSSAAFYSTWAANHTFAIGDILGKLFFFCHSLKFIYYILRDSWRRRIGAYRKLCPISFPSTSILKYSFRSNFLEKFLKIL